MSNEKLCCVIRTFLRQDFFRLDLNQHPSGCGLMVETASHFIRDFLMEVARAKLADFFF